MYLLVCLFLLFLVVKITFQWILHCYFIFFVARVGVFSSVTLSGFSQSVRQGDSAQLCELGAAFLLWTVFESTGILVLAVLHTELSLSLPRPCFLYFSLGVL